MKTTDPEQAEFILLNKLKGTYFFEIYIKTFVRCLMYYVIIVRVPLMIMTRVSNSYTDVKILAFCFFLVDSFLRCWCIFLSIKKCNQIYRDTVWWLYDLSISTKKAFKSYKYLLTNYINCIEQLRVKTTRKIEYKIYELHAILYSIILLVLECILL